jgi:hypothetical protein
VKAKILCVFCVSCEIVRNLKQNQKLPFVQKERKTTFFFCCVCFSSDNFLPDFENNVGKIMQITETLKIRGMTVTERFICPNIRHKSTSHVMTSGILKVMDGIGLK